jgi:hypothetical protein
MRVCLLVTISLRTVTAPSCFGVVGPKRARRLQYKPDEFVQTAVATSSGRAASRAINAYAFHAAEILPDIFTPRRIGIPSLAPGSTEERRTLSEDTPRHGCKGMADLR